jgi:CobQ-like glutamine amidotransferase family enzyme
MELRIAHLYAHFLNIYGDRGNIISLSQRAKWRGIEVKVDSIDIRSGSDPDYYDFYFIGGGQDKQQIVIAEDLLKRATNKGGCQWRGGGLNCLRWLPATGTLLSPHEGPELKGISLLDAYTVAGNRRMIGNVVIKREDSSTLSALKITAAKPILGKDVQPLGKIVVGNGNNGEDKRKAHARAPYTVPTCTVHFCQKIRPLPICY